MTGNANATVHSITIDGHTTALVSGGFTLGPGEFASIDWTTMVPGSSPNFLASLSIARRRAPRGTFSSAAATAPSTRIIPTFLVVSGEMSGLEVTDCAGYNDLGNTILYNATSAPSGAFSGITYGYYGPTAFYLAATGATVTIDGQNTHLSSGGFTLAPGKTAQISSGTVTHFLIVGK